MFLPGGHLSMKTIAVATVFALCFEFSVRVDAQGESHSQDSKSLRVARNGFTTQLIRNVAVGEAVPVPPAGVLTTVRYHSQAGELAAYVTPSPADGKKHLAIIWIVGGFGNSIGETAWEKAPPGNDQSASSFREAHVITMYPSMRGGNKNPGFVESFYGEVDDIIAAREYLAKLEYVDPKRIYLGGHSTGGTLALLVSESTDVFRSVFAFGPVEDVSGYGADYLTFDPSNRKEAELRAPIKWLDGIRSPTFVFEGTERRSNITSLRALSRATRNPVIHFNSVPGNHFSILAPVSRLVAAKITTDEGPSCYITFTEKELSEASK